GAVARERQAVVCCSLPCIVISDQPVEDGFELSRIADSFETQFAKSFQTVPVVLRASPRHFLLHVGCHVAAIVNPYNLPRVPFLLANQPSGPLPHDKPGPCSWREVLEG